MHWVLGRFVMQKPVGAPTCLEFGEDQVEMILYTSITVIYDMYIFGRMHFLGDRFYFFWVSMVQYVAQCAAEMARIKKKFHTSTLHILMHLCSVINPALF